MPDQYDDDKPAERWVFVGYALTGDGRLDRDRINNPRPELLPVVEAKRIVDNGHGRYATDAETEAAATGPRQQITPPLVAAESPTDAAPVEHPDDPRARLWGGGNQEPPTAAKSTKAKAKPIGDVTNSTSSEE